MKKKKRKKGRGNYLADLHAKHALLTKGLFIEQKETFMEKL